MTQAIKNAHYGPHVETNGLEFAFDAGDNASYPGSNQTLYDLAKNNNGTGEGQPATSSWTTGGDLNHARSRTCGAGEVSAGLIMGGYSSNPWGHENTSEEYNGSSWADAGDIATGREYLGGCGTQSAGLCMGGQWGSGGGTEEYNGTSWSAGGALGTQRMGGGGCGTQSAALYIGGDYFIYQKQTTEHYNGSSWSNGGDISVARRWGAAAGTTSAAVFAGGYGPTTSLCEEYNGSSWTTVNSLLATRHYCSSAGTQTDAIMSGGGGSSTEKYDGTTWSSNAGLNYARGGGMSAGVPASNNFMVAGAAGSSMGEKTEEYTQAPANTLGTMFNSGNNGYFVFNGSSHYIDLPDMGFSGNAAISVTAWAQVSNLSLRNMVWSSGIAGSMQRIDFEMGSPVGQSAGNIGIHFSGRTWSTNTDIISANTWYHVAFTITGSSTLPGNLKYYINGVNQSLEQSQGSGDATLNLVDSNYFIGVRSEASANSSPTGLYLGGKIASLQVYSQGLTAGKVLQNYEAHKARFGL